MRILFLTTQFPWPATSGGSVRTLSQLRILASLPEVHSLTILSVAETDVRESDRYAFSEAITTTPDKVRVLSPIFHPVHLFDFRRHLARAALLRVVQNAPYLAVKWDSPDLRKSLNQELAATPFDVVYIDHLGMAHYSEDVRAIRPQAHVILDQHNVESDFFKQLSDRHTGLKKLAAKMEHRASERFERRALQDATSVVAISDDDAKTFHSLAGVQAHVVPLVLPFTPRRRVRPPSDHFCFVGNLRWQPNVAGLDWFCRDVWRRIRDRVPGATLEIAGVGLKKDARGSPVVPDAWRAPGITTVGFVEDLEPLYSRSLAMLAPVFGGSGVRVKLLEAFRAGTPLVTTPDGAAGLTLEDGREALVAGDPDAFAERAERIVKDEALRQTLCDSGYLYLERHHSLSVAQDAMRGALSPKPHFGS